MNHNNTQRDRVQLVTKLLMAECGDHIGIVTDQKSICGHVMATFYEEATLRSKGTIVLYIELDNRETMIVSIEEKNPAVYTEGQVVLEPESSQKQKTTVGAPQDMKMFDRANTDE